MKIINLLSLVITFIVIVPTTKAIAQEPDREREIRVTDLKVPVSPTINLLGVAPAEIAEPTAPKAFGFTVLESATNSQGNFPNNFAIELAPFWWFPHPNLNFNEYYQKTGFGEAILSHLSISAGTTSAEIRSNGEVVDGSRVGLGIRTSLLAGGQPPQLQRKVQKYLDLTRICSREPEDCTLEADKLAAIADVNALLTDRVGWQLDVANAYVFDALEDDIGELNLSRIGVWFTSSYRSVGVKELVAAVPPEICQAEIKSVLKYGTGVNSTLSDRDFEEAADKYDCARRPNATNIIFFDRNTDAKVGNCRVTDFLAGDSLNAPVEPETLQQRYVCVRQSGLSVLKIVDNSLISSPDCQEKLDSLKQEQNRYRQLFRDIDRTDSLVSNPTLQSYECATLTLPRTEIVDSQPAIESVIIDRGSTINLAANEPDNRIAECQILVDDFLQANNLQDTESYTCAQFSQPDFVIAIDEEAARNIDKECASKIEEQKSALKFLQSECVYQPSRVSFLGIGRYIRDEFTGEREDNFDLGTRVIWHPKIDSQLQISAEYLRRFGGENDDRLVGGVRYRFNDTYELFSSVGKAFDDGFDGENLITIFGLNIGLGKSTLKQLEQLEQ